MYRPQFAVPPVAPPCTDQPVMYSFDSTNCPVLLGSLASGASTGRIPLQLDKDAAHWIQSIDQQATGISIRLEDPNGNPLSDLDNATQQQNFEFPSEYSYTAGAGFVALESGGHKNGMPGIFAPRGSNFLLYLYNNTTGTIQLNTVAVNLVGIKRYTSELCQ